jgi:hypothetical protein
MWEALLLLIIPPRTPPKSGEQYDSKFHTRTIDRLNKPSLNTMSNAEASSSATTNNARPSSNPEFPAGVRPAESRHRQADPTLVQPRPSSPGYGYLILGHPQTATFTQVGRYHHISYFSTSHLPDPLNHQQVCLWLGPGKLHSQRS